MGSAIHHRLTKLVLLTRQYELPHKQGPGLGRLLLASQRISFPYWAATL